LAGRLRFTEAVVIVLLRMPDSSRRELYRIVYPLVERPTFETGRFLFEVIDCSEKGLRYEVRDRRMPTVGTELGGTLLFRRGDEVPVQGEVIRAREGVVVLALDPPLPFAEVLAEQRYLRSKGYTLKD
jgi:hypothetical protein